MLYRANSTNHTYTGVYTSFKCLPGFLLLALISLSPVVSAAVYKWVDADGKIHYSAEKPENADAERMKIATPKVTPPVPADKKDPNKTTADKSGNTRPDDPKTGEQPAATETPAPVEEAPVLSRKEKQQRCNSARERLTTLQSRSRIRETDEKGNVSYLTDKQRLNSLTEAKKDVSQLCR